MTGSESEHSHSLETEKETDKILPCRTNKVDSIIMYSNKVDGITMYSDKVDSITMYSDTSKTIIITVSNITEQYIYHYCTQ